MKNKILLSSLISAAFLNLTACGGGGSDQSAQHLETDVIAPLISINGADEVVLEVGQRYIDAGATATDNVDPSVNVVTRGSYNTDEAGTYTLTYSATDLAGNTATATRTIKVIEKEGFNKYNGRWVINCEETTNQKLTNIGVFYINKIMMIDDRNVSYRMRGFGKDNSSCAGAPVLKGTAYGRVVYTGKIISDTYTGDKVDVTLTEAHYSGVKSKVIEVPYDSLDDYAEKMGMPYYDILALTGDGKLVTGDLTDTDDGSSNDKRPKAFDNLDPYYKVN